MIIERCRRRETSVEESMVEMYLVGVSVCLVEDITEALWGTNNALERSMREIGKRSKVVGAFPDGNSAIYPESVLLKH